MYVAGSFVTDYDLLAALLTHPLPLCSQKKSGENTQTVGGSGGNYNAMVYQGALVYGGAASSPAIPPPLFAVAVLVGSLLRLLVEP